MKKRVLCGILLFTLLLSGCNAGGKTDAAPEPESLDLSGGALTDLSALYEMTQLKSLDIRDNDVSRADYDALSSALPACDIRWSVPLSSGPADSAQKALVLSGFTAEDLDLLGYFPNLVSLCVTGEADYDALLAARARYAAVDFSWTVSLGGLTLQDDAEQIVFSDASISYDALLAALPGLPELTRIDFAADTALSDAQMRALISAYPNVTFNWRVEVLPGVSAYGADEAIDLSGTPVSDVDALAEKLALLPGLKTAELCECGVPDEEMLRLRTLLPGVKLVWKIKVSAWEIRTDLAGFSTGVRSSFPNDGGRYLGGMDGYTSFRDGAFDNLVYCTDLVALDIGHCMKITDVSFVEKLPQLRYLVLAMLNTRDISALCAQTQLEFVEIYDNPITDLTPLLASRDTLKYLNCGMCDFTDIDVLVQLTNLERLWIADSKLTDAQIEALSAALPNTTIMAKRSRVDGGSAWRTGNWAYVEMQRIFGLRAQFQGDITPSPEPSPTPLP